MKFQEVFQISDPQPVYGERGILQRYTDSMRFVASANPGRSLLEIPQHGFLRDEKQAITTAAAAIASNDVHARHIVVSPHQSPVQPKELIAAFHALATCSADPRTLYIARFSEKEGGVIRSISMSDAEGHTRVSGFTTIVPTSVCADIFSSERSTFQARLEHPEFEDSQLAMQPQLLCIVKATTFHTLWSQS